MSHGIEGAGFSPQVPQDGAQRGQATANEGAFRGGRVVQNSHNSLIQDSLEELPANLAETFSKRLAERSAKGRNTSRIQQLMEKYLQSASQAEQPQNFQQLAESLKKLGNPTAEQLKRHLQEHLGDYEKDSIKDYESALLLALEETFASDNDTDDLLSVVREVKAQLGTDLQSFFEQQVQTFEGISDVYERVLGDHGPQDYLEATELLIRRLGNDLQAQSGSVEPNQLKATLDSLYHLEVARNTFLAFADLAEKMNTLFATGNRSD